jgi:methionine synthase II (cobalamin-independent)
LREAGVAGVSVDLSLVKELDPLGEAIDAGLVLYAGVAPTSGVHVPAASTLAERLRRVWHDLGFADELMTKQAVLTPACGLASSTPAYAQAVLKACREAAQRLTE